MQTVKVKVSTIASWKMYRVFWTAGEIVYNLYKEENRQTPKVNRICHEIAVVEQGHPITSSEKTINFQTDDILRENFTRKKINRRAIIYRKMVRGLEKKENGSLGDINYRESCRRKKWAKNFN